MAATASSSTSVPSSSSKHTMFDVFLSFRGEDTRDSFTDHLYAALNRAGIVTFRDNDAIKRGQDLEPELVKAIKESKASIVVISKNYAKSRWCLDELVLILDQRRKFNRFVLPVFYHVDPSNVRNQRQSFAIEGTGTKWTEVKENQWKAALNEVANLTGLVVSGSETNFITKIVQIVDSELDMKLVSTPAHLTGMKSRTKYINSWLKNEKSDVQILAICGMGGIGKTTLAKSIYNSHKQNFESSSFLEEIGKHNEQSYGLIALQEQLVTDILGEKKERIPGVSEGTIKIEKALQLKKALIVLDDIDDKDEISTLLGTEAFHTQSKIIITTRLLDVNAWFGSLSWKCHVHKMKLLYDYESLELLSWHAFGSNIPMEGFKELAIELARYCGGNPLALKVLGSSLFVSTEDPDTRNSMIEIWRSKLNFMNSQKGDLYCNIQRILQKSFDSLPCTTYKELFLHIAIYFVGEDEDYVASILEHDWHAKAGIKTLINRCMLTVSRSKKLMMHQLLQDMGKNIVREESKDAAKHTRVWYSDEAYRLLTKGDGSETIEGLTLDARKIKKGTKVVTIKTSSLAKMDKLKLLQLKYVRLSGSYNKFPGLTWLCWHGCHLETIPSGLWMNSLVSIDMSYGILKQFEPPMVLNSLKILNLASCKYLVSVCNLHCTPNLETLILRDCTRLIHLSKAVGYLKSLTLLNLRGCKNLWKASSNQLKRLKAVCIGGGGIPEQALFSLPPSLKFLFLDDCNLDNNSDLREVFHVQSLFGMSLKGNLFEFFPNKINISMLRVLNLRYCEKLKSLLCLPGTLEELYTSYCTSLEKITFQSARFRLRRIVYKGCSKLSEIQGLFKLVSIKKLDEADMGNMKWIKAYEDFEVDLVGSIITNGRIWHTQMLHEYGIRSVYLQGIQDQSLTFEYMSSSSNVSFCVPLCAKQRKIQNLTVITLYRYSYKNTHSCTLFAKISNTTKGLTWIYNPVIFCKPRIDEDDVVWLCDWPIGNILDTGDVVNVNIIVGNGLVVRGCGASLVYVDDGEVKQENVENYSKEEEVIGGDLSGLQLKTGEYFLSRRNFSDRTTTNWFKMLLGDHALHYTVLLGQVINAYSDPSEESFMNLRFSLELHRDTLNKYIFLGYFDNESEIRKIKKMVSSLVGVEYVCYYKERKDMYVSGLIDCIDVETIVREFDKKARIMCVGYNVKRLLKVYRLNIIWWTFGDNSRCEDTRDSFTDHLYDALKQTGIDTFKDNEEINKGDALKPEIERAIKELRASIVVFSEN